MPRQIASTYDVRSIKRSVGAVNDSVDLIAPIIESSLAKTAKSTSVTQLSLSTLTANSADFGGLNGTGSWASPYVVNKWHSAVDVKGKGELYWVSFSSNRGGSYTATGQQNDIKITIDGITVYSGSTIFQSQDSVTSYEYVAQGVMIGTTRVVQYPLYFKESLLIEVRSAEPSQPKPTPFINYQLY